MHGKQKWLPLDTDVLSVAKLRLADKAAEMAKRRGSLANVEAGKATVGDLIAVYVARTKANSDLRPASVSARLVALKKLKKTWPDVEFLAPKQITPSAVFDWVTRFKLEGTNYLPPGAKTAIKGNSTTSVNRAIDTLRRLMDIALERGQIHINPVSVKPPTGCLKKKVVKAKIILPGMAEGTSVRIEVMAMKLARLGTTRWALRESPPPSAPPRAGRFRRQSSGMPWRRGSAR